MSQRKGLDICISKRFSRGLLDPGAFENLLSVLTDAETGCEGGGETRSKVIPLQRIGEG